MKLRKVSLGFVRLRKVAKDRRIDMPLMQLSQIKGIKRKRKVSC